MSTFPLFQKHPPQNVYKSLLTLHGNGSLTSKQQSLSNLPHDLRQKIFNGILEQHQKTSKESSELTSKVTFAETHVFDNQFTLRLVVQQVAIDLFRLLDKDQREVIAHQIWQHRGSPVNENPDCKENLAIKNTLLLLRTMGEYLGTPDQQFNAILDAWVAGGGESENRARARHRIVDFLSSESNALYLNGLGLTSLPMIFDQKYNSQSTALPRWVSQLQKLKELDLFGNQLTSIPEQIGKCQNLRTLNLTNNRLESIPEQIGKCQNLRTLNLSNNRLESIPEEIQECRSLKDLNLSRNRIGSFPRQIGRCRNLRTLNLSNNRLESVPKEIGTLEKLTNLNLSNNRLDSVSKEIGKCQNLIDLNLSDNQLQSIPKEIGKCEKLEKLYISHNWLGSIPEQIGECPHLRILYLPNNQLDSVPEQIGKLKSLQVLKLSNNWIDALPKEIGQCSDLRVLQLEGNVLESIPEEIGQCRYLRILHLSNNSIDSIPEEIGECELLEELDLNSNQLQSVPEEIGECVHLRTLNLADNQTLQGLPNELLSLSRCIIDLGRTGLSEHVRNNLREAASTPDYEGPRILFSTEHVEGTLSNELRSISELINELFSISEEESRRFVELENLAYEEKSSLQSWLSRLSAIADYDRGGDRQKALVKQIVAYLQQANDDPEFRGIFFNIIVDAAETCGDRMALCLLHIGIQSDLRKTKDISALSKLLIKTVWPLKMLEEIARKKIQKLTFFDEIEVYLAFPIMLRAQLGLQIVVNEMLHFTCSALKQKDLNKALKFVQEQQNNRGAVCSYLSGHETWVNALRERYPSDCAEIDSKGFEELAQAEEGGPITIDEVKINTKKRWEILTARALEENAESPH